MAEFSVKSESVTIRHQNSSQAQNLKNPNPKTPNPKRKLIIQNSKDEFVWDELSCSREKFHSVYYVV